MKLPRLAPSVIQSCRRVVHGSPRMAPSVEAAPLLLLPRTGNSSFCGGNKMMDDRMRSGSQLNRWMIPRFYSGGGPASSEPSSSLEEGLFHDLADDVLRHLQEKIEILGEDLNVAGFDSDYADGVLTIRLGSLGTYVINKQTPNRQIWLSSPVSGPGRFDWVGSRREWVYRRTNRELTSLLEEELSRLLDASIHLR